MSTTLRPWLHHYITALPKPDIPLPTAASLQITDYSTEPPAAPSELPRVTAIVSDGHLRIRAPVDDAALRAVRDSTPLPQWRGAIIALDNWTLSYTADEFIVQLHAFHVLQAVGSSDIGSSRHCMDDREVRHTHTVLRQVNTTQRHQHVLTSHTKLFPNTPLPPPLYSTTQPIPAELAAVRPPSTDLSFLYSVPELCQRELDRLEPKESGGGMEVSGVGEASGGGLSQWSSGSDEKDDKEQEYFSQYAGLRQPFLPPAQSRASPLFPPLTAVTPLPTSASSTAVSTASTSSPPAVVESPTVLLQPLKTGALTTPSLLLSQSAPHHAIYSQLSLTPSPLQPNQRQAPPSPAQSVSSAASSQPVEDAVHLLPASQHNLMETSLERDAMQADDDDLLHTSTVPPLIPPPSQPLQPSQPQLAQPHDDDSSLLPSQPLQSSQSSEVEEVAAAAAPFVDDGFFMTQAPSVSEYASQQLAASQAVSGGSTDSDDDVVFDLDEQERAAVSEVSGVSAAGRRAAAAVDRLMDDFYPSSMPPLSPGPPSPAVKDEEGEETKEGGVHEARAEMSVLEVRSEAEAELQDESTADGASHFSAEMIARRQRERNAELLRQRQDKDFSAPLQSQPQGQQHVSRQAEPRDEAAVGRSATDGVLAKRGRSSVVSGGGSERGADKRRRSVRFDEERNMEHMARDDGSDGSSVASESGQSLAELLRGVSVEEVAGQPMAVFDGWSGDDFAWHCSYWQTVQL